MGLYDNFNLSNSTQVLKQPGIPIDALSQTLGVLNDRYMQSRSQWDALKRGLNTTNVNPIDRKTFDSAVDPIRKKIQEVQQNGNYEDMLWAAQEAGNQLAGIYAPFAEENKRFVDYLDQIDKSKASISHKQALKAEAMKSYKGVRQDEGGRWVGSNFTGNAIAESVDVGAFVRDALKGLDPVKYSGEGISIEQSGGGEYFVKRGNSREVISPEMVQQAIRLAAGLNPGLQDYIQQDARLRTMGLEDLGYEDVGAGDSTVGLASEAKRLAELDPSRSFGSFYRELAQNHIVEGYLGTAEIYGTTLKARDNISNSISMVGETADGRVNTAERIGYAEETGKMKADAQNRIVIETAPVEKETNFYEKVKERNEAGTKITELEKALSSAKDPEDRDAIQLELDAAKDKQRMINDAFREVTSRLANKLPKIIETDSGGITKEQFLEAVNQGKMDMDSNWLLGDDRVVTVGGKRHVIKSNLAKGFFNEFDKRLSENNNANVHVISNSPRMSKELGNHITANPRNFKFLDDQGNEIGGSDLEDAYAGTDFNPTTQQTRTFGDNTSTVHSGTYKNSSGKEKRFNAVPAYGSNNLDYRTAAELRSESRGRPGSNTDIGARLSSQNVKRLDDMYVGGSMAVGSDEKEVTIKKVRTEGQRIIYRIYGTDGKQLQTQGGTPAYYTNSVEAVEAAERLSK